MLRSGLAGRVDGEPHCRRRRAAAAACRWRHRRPRSPPGRRIYARDPTEAARADRRSPPVTGREPGARPLDAGAPGTGAGQGKEAAHRLRGIGDDAGESGGIALITRCADDLAHRASIWPNHGPPPGAVSVSSIVAARGCGAPLAAGTHRDHPSRDSNRSPGSNTRRVACMAPSACIEDERHVVELVVAHAMLAGDAAAGRDARGHDLRLALRGLLGKLHVPPVEADVRQVAVAETRC